MPGLHLVNDKGNLDDPIVIAVHGVDGRGNRAWDPLSSGVWGYEEWFSYQGIQVAMYSYSVITDNTSIFTEDGLRSEAARLLQAIVDLNRGRSSRFLLLGHDMGGILIKEALVQAAFGNPKFRSIYWSTYGVVFIGCPHRCESLNSLKDSVTRLFHGTGLFQGQCAEGVAASTAILIDRVNQDFAGMNSQRRAFICNISSVNSDEKKRVFNPSETQMKFNSAWEGHHQDSTLCHLEMSQVMSAKTRNIAEGYLSGEWRGEWPSPEMIILSSPRQYSVEEALWDEEIGLHTKTLMDGPEFRAWDSSYGPSFLEVQNAPASIVTAMLWKHCSSKKIISDTPRTNLIQFFEFKEHDCRYDSVDSMLSTFLSEICYNTTQICDKRDDPHYWKRKEPILSMENQVALLLEVLSVPTCPKIVWILVNFSEQVLHHQWLVDKFKELSSSTELNLNVLAVNCKGIAFRDCGFPTLDYAADAPGDQMMVTGDASVSDVQKHLFDTAATEIIIQNPSLQNVRSKLIPFLRSSSTDPELRQLVADWLSSTNPSVIKGFLDDEQISVERPMSKTIILDFILKSFNHVLEAEGKIEILQLIVLSFRPLTTYELLDVAEANGCRQRSRMNFSQSEAIQLFPQGMLKLSGSELHFNCSDLRDLFISSTEHGPTGSFGNHGHARVAELCLKFIISSRDRLALGEYPIGPEPRLDFLDYAVRYWPAHAKKAKITLGDDPSSAFQTLLKDNFSLVRWAASYSTYSKTFIRLGLRAGPIAILAEHGLDDLLGTTMAHHEDAAWFHEDIATALITATACQHVNTLLLLMDRADHGKDVLKRAFLDSLYLPDQNIQNMLLKKLLAVIQEFKEISDILEAATGLGCYDIVQSLGAKRSDGHIHQGLESALLRAASIQGNLDAVENICNQEDCEVSRADRMTAIELSLQHHHHDTSVFLIQSILHDPRCDDSQKGDSENSNSCQASQQTPSDGLQHILEITVKSGQHRILASFLKLFTAHNARPKSVESLLQIAIDREKTMCFELLFKAFCREVNAKIVNSIVMKGTSNMLRALFAMENIGIIDGTIITDGIDHVAQRAVGDCDVVEPLLAAGKSHLSDKVYTEQVTNMLEFAVRENKPKLAGLLIRAGADLEKKTMENGLQTPLFYAAYHGFEELAMILLDAKADPRARELGSRGWEPIHAACDNPTILRSLLERDVEINVRASDGYTPLMLAVIWNREDCVDALLNHHPNLHCYAEGNTLLSLNSQSSGKSLIFRLLDAGMDPSHPDVIEINKKQLYQCVNDNNFELLQRLLLYNFPLEQEDDEGRTLLGSIQKDTEMEILRLLVYRGASVNATDKYNQTPLKTMILANKLQEAEFLISRGASADIPDYRGYTPFSAACSVGSLEMIQMLIKNKASLDEVHYETPFQFVCQRDDKEGEKLAILQYLLDEARVDPHQTSKRWGSNLSVACLTGGMEIVRDLIGRKVSVHDKDAFGRRPIHFALYRTIEHVLHLLDHGADMFVKDIMGRNALHFAVVSGRLDLVKFVIEQKPTLVNEMDCDNWTPLLWAVRECGLWDTHTAERGAIITELISHGAETTIQGLGVERRWTPYELALYYNLEDEILDLLKPSQEQLEKSKDNSFWQRFSQMTREGFKKAQRVGGWCDACLMSSIGLYYTCDECTDFWLCFKCYRSRDNIHPGHDFTKQNYEQEDTHSDREDTVDHSDDESQENMSVLSEREHVEVFESEGSDDAMEYGENIQSEEDGDEQSDGLVETENVGSPMEE